MHKNISANQIKIPFKLRQKQCNAPKNIAKYVDNFMSFIAEKLYKLNEQLNPLTGIHEHSIQYITPNGGPKSAYHFEPNSRNVFPNRHSATAPNKNKRKKLKRQEKLIKFIKERPFFSHKRLNTLHYKVTER